MTYQADFASDKYAQIAADVGAKHSLPSKFMHHAALCLCLFDKDVGPKHDDHLRQVATEWAKEWSIDK